MLSFFPRDVLDEIWELIESVSGGGGGGGGGGFPTYSYKVFFYLSCIEPIKAQRA